MYPEISQTQAVVQTQTLCLCSAYTWLNEWYDILCRFRHLNPTGTWSCEPKQQIKTITAGKIYRKMFDFRSSVIVLFGAQTYYECQTIYKNSYVKKLACVWLAVHCLPKTLRRRRWHFFRVVAPSHSSPFISSSIFPLYS